MDAPLIEKLFKLSAICNHKTATRHEQADHGHYGAPNYLS